MKNRICKRNYHEKRKKRRRRKTIPSYASLLSGRAPASSSVTRRQAVFWKRTTQTGRQYIQREKNRGGRQDNERVPQSRHSLHNNLSTGGHLCAAPLISICSRSTLSLNPSLSFYDSFSSLSQLEVLHGRHPARTRHLEGLHRRNPTYTRHLVVLHRCNLGCTRHLEMLHHRNPACTRHLEVLLRRNPACTRHIPVEVLLRSNPACTRRLACTRVLVNNMTRMLTVGFIHDILTSVFFSYLSLP